MSGAQPHQHWNRPEGHQNSGQSAKGAKQQAFGQKLSNQLKSACPDRRANREFLLPVHRPSQEQIGDVHAGDQPHCSHRAEEQQKSGTNVAGNLITEWNQIDRPAFGLVNLFVLQRQSRHLGLGLLQ